MFQEITEETLKVRPLYNKKKSHQLNSRVRYQAIAMAMRKQLESRTLGCRESTQLESQPQLAPNRVELLNNPSTIPREARGEKWSLKVVIRPAPAGVGINGPPMVRLMLRTNGVKDCLVRVQGDPRLGVNLARAMDSAIRRL